MNIRTYLLLVILICPFVCSYSVQSDCLWSTYRPGPYFGLRATIENSPLFGIMWYYQEKMDSVKTLRHFMENSDNLEKYEWNAHNGCDYGQVHIVDEEMNVQLDISFVNTYEEVDGNNWVVRVDGKVLENEQKQNGIAILWYISNPNSNSKLYQSFGLEYENKTISGGYFKESKFTEFKVISTQSSMNKHPSYNGVVYDNEYYLVLKISEDKLYDPTEYIIGELKDIVGNIPNHLIDSNDSYRMSSVTKGNVFIQQLFFIGSFSFDIHLFENKIQEEKLKREYISGLIEFKSNEFETKFNKTFSSKSYFEPYFSFSSNDDENRRTSISALSTLFSNILYMNGKMQILNSDLSVEESKSMDLLTIGPDKTSHARGFIWDEGFQQRILSIWNLEQSLRIITNWFNNVDEETGWLAREQSLDNESRSRAPPSSWASIPNVSNPPALFLLIDLLFERKVDESILKPFLQGIITNVEKNAQWYITTQESSIQDVFSWKGKTDDFCLPSGLDDYPRARINGKNLPEGHLDLQSWMIALSRSMIKMYKLLTQKGIYDEKINYWSNKYNNLLKSLLNNFWDNVNSRFDDFYINEEGGKIFSGHTGYMQIFPLILDVLETSSFNDKNEDFSKYINSSLEFITNPDKGLKTPYGIRSLSIHDPFYRQGQNYWTSPIWININYLIVKTLHKLKDIAEFTYLSTEYESLRSGIVNNIVNNFTKNGYIWEVYDDVDGHGKYNHPFTGWSALLINLMYELY